MARLVKSSGYDRALMGGFVSSNYLLERKEQDRANFRDNVARTRGTEYLERYDDRRRALDMDVLASRALAINRYSKSAFRDDMIMDAYDVSDMQHLSYRTSRYILSNPRVNYLARNQRIEAWGISRDVYAHKDDEYLGNDPFYRAMNHGMMNPDGGDCYVDNFIFHEDDQTVEHLDYIQQRSLYRTRDTMLAILEEGGEDPSSKMNNLL